MSTKLASLVGARRSPLCQHYPPDGYVAWHHNANIPGRNIIFSWSETGAGISRIYGDSKEIEEYQQKRHEMVLAKAKYEDKMSKNKKSGSPGPPEK